MLGLRPEFRVILSARAAEECFTRVRLLPPTSALSDCDDDDR
jgi:hypothetical protein